MISRERQRRETSENNADEHAQNTWNPIQVANEETPFDPLTPEESAIRWATQNGRTLNI